MTARNGQDLFGFSPAPAAAADHTARVAEWTQGLARLASTRDPCPGFRTGQWRLGIAFSAGRVGFAPEEGHPLVEGHSLVDQRVG